jgi:hypothetical protein
MYAVGETIGDKLASWWYPATYEREAQTTSAEKKETVDVAVQYDLESESDGIVTLHDIIKKEGWIWSLIAKNKEVNLRDLILIYELDRRNTSW